MIETIGQYRVLSPLGAGGMGEVYLAVDTRLQRKVALKLLPEALRDDGERLRRFEQEARAASAINHAHIAHIYEIGEDHGVHFIAMELVEGETLDDRFIARRPNADEFRSIVEQTTQALAAAHARGIIHRDLKPRNIMISPEGEIKVLDFGLAKLASPAGMDSAATHGSQSGVVAGTPAFMSPEQALGKELDARTDIFSLGAVFYSLWAGGRSPCEGANSTESLARLMDPTPFDLSAVPAEFRTMVGRCLEKDREKRCSSMRELLGGGPDEAHGHRAPWTRETLVATLLLVAVAGGWIFLHRGGSIDSVAVVPFGAFTGDPEAEFLSHGMSEELTDRLSALPHLRVPSWDRVQQLYWHQKDPLAVGRQLGVASVLSGNVTTRDGRISLTADLYDCASGRHLWGGRYERGPSELISLQDQVSREAAAELRTKSSAADLAALTRHRTENPESYRLYLEARHLTRRLTVESMRRGLEVFERAIALDPSYATAYAGKAMAFISAADWLLPNTEASLQARDYAERALSLDDQLAEAHFALGSYSVFYARDYERGAVEFRRGLELAPASTAGFRLAATLLCLQHRFDEAVSLMETAMKREPELAQTTTEAAFVRYAAHRFPEALALLDRARSLDAGYPPVMTLRGNVLTEMGRYSEAEAEFRRVREVDRSAWLKANFAHCLARAGKTAEARALLKELLALRDQQDGTVSATDIARVYAGLAERDKAMGWLERSLVDHGGTVRISFDPHYDSLRGDERFRAILRRLHLPESFPGK